MSAVETLRGPDQHAIRRVRWGRGEGGGMWFLIPTASALPVGDTSTCAQLVIEATLPVDGDVDVPPDVILTIVHNNGCGSRPEPVLMDDLTRTSVDVVVEHPQDTVARVVPTTLLAIGT